VRFAESIWLFGVLGALALGVVMALGGVLGQRAVRRFGEAAVVTALFTARPGGRRALKAVLVVLALCLAFVALAAPQYGRGTRVLPATNLDVAIVLDYSKSMYARDVSPSRIERAKAEVGRLVADLPGARFGAVAFAGEAMEFPLTSDGAAIAQFFRQLSPNDMPVGGTAIARALEAARELLLRDPLSKEHEKIIVLVTDGEDLEGDPVSVAETAKKDAITIEVVQVGGRTPEPIPEVNEVGEVLGYRKNADGETLTTSLSAAGEETLSKIAETTSGLIVRSQKGETGIPAIADRLRHLMTEELSERVETVYADVYAYPLALALLLLVVETLIPEASGRRRPKAPEPPPPDKKRERRRRRPGSTAAGVAAAALLPVLLAGCERLDQLFVRDAPAVTDAIGAMDAGDAGAAVSLLQEYLSTGQCENGNIGTPDNVRSRPNAAFDLGLGLFAIAERYGKRFEEEPTPHDGGLSPNEEAELAKRSAEVECALRIVRLTAADQSVPIELRARAFYLAGNLEFLRHSYKDAVASYDASLKLVPGLPEDAGDGIGRDAAYNRAIAQRRIEESERDAGPPDGSPDSGPPEGGADSGPEDGGDQNENEDGGNDGGSDANEPDAGPPDAGPDGGGQDQPKDQPNEQKEKEQPKQQPSVSQDERLLDQLEQAPTLQEHTARRAAARGRAVMEDK
jgi:Ca-activated chloride channel family protein